MDYSRKRTEKEQAYMDAGLPVQQVIPMAKILLKRKCAMLRER